MRGARGLGRSLGQHAAVEAALVEERANALGRIGARLEAAIEAWEALDADPEASPEHRDAALSEVAQATWLLIVQRECSGFRYDNLAEIRRHYRIPPAALRRI